MPPSAIETVHPQANGHTNGVNSSKSIPLKASAAATTHDSSRLHAASTEDAIHAEHEYAAHNYHPLPIVFARASGASVWDPEGKEYIDFLSAYSAVNQGHCHPELVKALTEQASRLTLSSRAFYNDVFPRFAEFVTKFFGFGMVLPMNTGAEAVETAVKIARKWAYKVKGVPQNEAIVLSVRENFHGRTFAAISMSSDPESRENYGPYLPNVGNICPATKQSIPYNDIPALRTAFEAHGSKIAGFLVEPIQGEAGIVVPDDSYLTSVRELCDKHNILLICDEIQTGIARTGKLLCHEWSGIKPDLVLLGKAISGGMYPVSCVLGRRDVMLTIEPGTHGSTYGGNPLGSAVAIRALELVRDEDLVARAEKLGQIFRQGLADLQSPVIKTIRGKGLLNAIIVDETKTNSKTAWDLCLLLKEKGLLVGRALKIAHVGAATATAAEVTPSGRGPEIQEDSVIVGDKSANVSGVSEKAKPTHVNIIRLAPPLVISEEQIRRAVEIVGEAIGEMTAGVKGGEK